jgi:hypothetical protein
VSHKAQTRAEDAAVYAHVTARDVTCRAPRIDFHNSEPRAHVYECGPLSPSGHIPLERHHAGNKIGGKRITDARHVVLLCEFHHRTWAPTRSRLILKWLADLEDARERARFDAEEDAQEAGR